MKSLSGMLFCASGIVLMCCMDATAKALGAELSTFQVVFLRYLGAAIWLTLWIALTGASWPKKSDLGRQAQRGDGRKQRSVDQTHWNLSLDDACSEQRTTRITPQAMRTPALPAGWLR